MLHEGQPRRRLEIGIALLGDGMGRMVRCDNVDAPVVEGRNERLAVIGCLDSRVALDACAEALVLRVVKPQVVYAYLGRNPLLGSMRLGKQSHFDGRRKMQDVQQRIMAPGEIDSHVR